MHPGAAKLSCLTPNEQSNNVFREITGRLNAVSRSEQDLTGAVKKAEEGKPAKGSTATRRLSVAFKTTDPSKKVDSVGGGSAASEGKPKQVLLQRDSSKAVPRSQGSTAKDPSCRGSTSQLWGTAAPVVTRMAGKKQLPASENASKYSKPSSRTVRQPAFGMEKKTNVKAKAAGPPNTRLLNTAAYWVDQVRLAEAIQKHSVALGFFRLAVECEAEPTQVLREELIAYKQRHGLCFDSIDHVLLLYGVGDKNEETNASAIRESVPLFLSEETPNEIHEVNQGVHLIKAGENGDEVLNIYQLPMEEFEGKANSELQASHQLQHIDISKEVLNMDVESLTNVVVGYLMSSMNDSVDASALKVTASLPDSKDLDLSRQRFTSHTCEPANNVEISVQEKDSDARVRYDHFSVSDPFNNILGGINVERFTRQVVEHVMANANEHTASLLVKDGISLPVPSNSLKQASVVINTFETSKHTGASAEHDIDRTVSYLKDVAISTPNSSEALSNRMDVEELKNRVFALVIANLSSQDKVPSLVASEAPAKCQVSVENNNVDAKSQDYSSAILDLGDAALNSSATNVNAQHGDKVSSDNMMTLHELQCVSGNSQKSADFATSNHEEQPKDTAKFYELEKCSSHSSTFSDKDNSSVHRKPARGSEHMKSHRLSIDGQRDKLGHGATKCTAREEKLKSMAREVSSSNQDDVGLLEVKGRRLSLINRRNSCGGNTDKLKKPVLPNGEAEGADNGVVTSIKSGRMLTSTPKSSSKTESREIPLANGSITRSRAKINSRPVGISDVGNKLVVDAEKSPTIDSLSEQPSASHGRRGNKEMAAAKPAEGGKTDSVTTPGSTGVRRSARLRPTSTPTPQQVQPKV